MRPPMNTFLKAVAALFGVVALLASAAGVASASDDEAVEDNSTSTTVDVKYGADGVSVGTATITRTDGVDSDTLAVTLNVGDFTESHLCLSTDPFTSKISPGQCDYSLGSGGSGDGYTVAIDPDETIYVQLHVVVSGETAYAGWVDGGSPPFGNVEVPNPEPPVTVVCPADEVPPAEGELVDENNDGLAENCVEVEETVTVPNIPVTNTVTCPDGSVITEDMNGDDVLNTEDCTEVLDEVEEPTPEAPVAPAEPATPGEPGTPAEPATPAPAPVLEVKPVAVTPVAAPTAANNPRVLGSQVTRTSQLPRTGDETTNLVPFGLGLVLLGFGLQRTSKRFSTARAS